MELAANAASRWLASHPLVAEKSAAKVGEVQERRLEK
jgi:hypothetical protein